MLKIIKPKININNCDIIEKDIIIIFWRGDMSWLIEHYTGSGDLRHLTI